MTTVLDVLTRAGRKCGIVADDEDMTAEIGANALIEFNDMLHEWKLRGVDLEHSDLVASDDFPLLPEFVSGVVHMLALRLSASYAVPIGFDADDFFRAIQIAYLVPAEATMPRSLTYMPSQRDRYPGTAG